MAILGDFEVAIVVDAKDLVEYDIPVEQRSEMEDDGEGESGSDSHHMVSSIDSDVRARRSERLKAKLSRKRKNEGPAKMSCMVGVTAGKSFSVRFSSNLAFYENVDFDGVSCILTVDGKVVVARACLEVPLEDVIKGRDSHSEGRHVIKPFRFAKINLDSNSSTTREELIMLKEKYSGLGFIKLRVYRVWDRGTADSQSSSDTGTVEDETVPEEAVKGRLISHHISYGNPEFCDDMVPAEVNYIDPPDQPFLTFEFHYIEQEALQKLVHVGRDRSPTPLDQRPLNELSRDEMIQLLTQQRGEIEGYKKVKHEAGGNSAVKRVLSPDSDEDFSIVEVKKTCNKLVGGDTIDLTDD